MYPLQPSPTLENDVIHAYAKHHAETTEAQSRSLCRIASGQALLLCCQQIGVLSGRRGQYGVRALPEQEYRISSQRFWVVIE